MPMVNSSRMTPTSAAASKISRSDDAEGVRSDEHAGEQEADDRDDAQPRAGVTDHRRGDDQRGDLAEEGRRPGLDGQDDRARDRETRCAHDPTTPTPVTPGALPASRPYEEGGYGASRRTRSRPRFGLPSPVTVS